MKKLLLSWLCSVMLAPAMAGNPNPVEQHDNPSISSETEAAVKSRNTGSLSTVVPLAIEDPSTARGARNNRGLATGVTIGTQGVGLDIQLPLMPQWQVRIGGTVLPAKMSRDYQVLPTKAATLNVQANFTKLHLVADWEPFANSRSRMRRIPAFKRKLAIKGGLNYFITGEGNARIIMKSPHQYGEIEMSPEDVGELFIDSDWKGAAPYLGVGFNRINISRALTLDVAFGAVHMPKPEVQITGTNMLRNNGQNSTQMQKNLSNYRLLPTLDFSINYSFTK